MRKVWKPTGKVFNEIGYSWQPSGRTFTIVENKCPLTRFTSTKVVPTKETTNKLVLTPTQGIIVYSRRSKAPKLVGSSSKSKITESRISNSSDLTQFGGSTVSDVPSSSLNDCSKFLGTVRFENDHISKIMGYGDYQIGNVTISRVYYVEGLGTGYIKNHKEYAVTKGHNLGPREERAQKKPKMQSQSQKKLTSSQNLVKQWSTEVKAIKDKLKMFQINPPNSEERAEEFKA
ncbi:hypothetical protein Tco_1195372 [Tanacetum coccineum]